MSFHNDVFPDKIAYGARGGPMFNTTILELESGHEKRNINWEKVRARYNVGHVARKPEYMDLVLNFFYARHGRAYSFPFKDVKDHKIVNQVIALGDGTTTEFQIYKQYESGGFTYDRLITKLIPDTLGDVMVGGVPQVLNGGGADGFTVNNLTGKLTFNTAPAEDDPIIVTYVEFYVHVRFDTDFMDIQMITWDAESWHDIFLVEIKEDEE